MTQERVIAQVKPRLQHCLEQRDRPGILALTTWLVHRHGYPLLQQLLSQPEWSSHRLWWAEQMDHPNDDKTESLDQPHDDVKLTPAQVTKQRLKMVKLTKPVPIQEKDGEAPSLTQAASKERPQRKPPGRQHRSLRLRDWLPRNRLPHQDAA